jgi:hypothetical protein
VQDFRELLLELRFTIGGTTRKPTSVNKASRPRTHQRILRARGVRESSDDAVAAEDTEGFMEEAEGPGKKRRRKDSGRRRCTRMPLPGRGKMTR